MTFSIKNSKGILAEKVFAKFFSLEVKHLSGDQAKDFQRLLMTSKALNELNYSHQMLFSQIARKAQEKATSLRIAGKKSSKV